MYFKSTIFFPLSCVVLSIGGLSTVTTADEVDYVKLVKPILRDRCFACHGALKQEGGLRLDTAALARQGGDSGAAINPGNVTASRLLARVTATDADERMPPHQEGEPLTSAQVEQLRSWIAAGAVGPTDEQPESDPSNHWSFQPIVRPPVPAGQLGWGRNPIDAFLGQSHQKHGLVAQPEASRIILLRRLHLDLIGIPPTLDEITTCEASTSPDWYEQTMLRLLDDPRHGERWARHWMDIWRYSDWWGLGEQLRNSQKHIWHWRDWIVESLNQDAPYDEMVRLMLAADELHPNDLDKLRATGYLARNYFLFNRPQWMEETVEHVSKGFLGLTVNCAKCHDHKFDPIAQIDYFRMRAFFEPYHVRLDVIPGEVDLTRDGIPRVYDRMLDDPTYLYVRGDEKNPDKSNAIPPGVPSILAFSDLNIEPVSLPDEARQPERRAWVLDAYIAAARSQVTAAESELKNLHLKSNLAKESETQASTANAALDAAPSSRSPEASAGADVQAELKLAEAALASAHAEQESVVRRVEAQRAEWSPSTVPLQELMVSAVRAERLALVAKARNTVAISEQAAHRAAAEKKEAANKTLKDAQENLEKAVAAAGAEVTAKDHYTRFNGAAWTPTRFFSSAKDDPTVEFPAISTGRRTALANWITDRSNPLTARVAVNHIWTRHMGQPLVPTMFDFGRKGTPPTHPELLDWLASELIDSGWSMKHVHSLIVNSTAYRMNSSLTGMDVAAAQDPENHLWLRRVPIRLESQVVRDSVLSLAGTLDFTIGGPSVPPSHQATSTRRSLYFFHSNNERNLFLATFDEALVKDCYRREQSIVPQQALALTNSRLALDASGQIAKRLTESASDETDFIRQAFRLVVGISAGESELSASEVALEAWRKQPGSSSENARTNLVWVLLNHNDFVTLR